MLAGYDESRWSFGKRKDALVKSIVLVVILVYIFTSDFGWISLFWTRLW